jgi:DNA-binding NarL/FixJ family response regulator
MPIDLKKLNDKIRQQSIKEKIALGKDNPDIAHEFYTEHETKIQDNIRKITEKIAEQNEQAFKKLYKKF